MKRDTRQEIVDTFIKMVEETSFSKARIAELTERLDINRNTFYYYFSDKQDIAMLVLRTDLDQELREAFPSTELICSPCFGRDAEKTPLAYYVHVETGARTLDASGFLRALARCTLARPTFYRKLFSPQELGFARGLATLYWPVIEDDINFVLDGRYMPTVTKRMLASLCVRYIISTTRFCLEDSDGASLLDDRVNPFWNMMHESLYAAIQSHPMNRYTRKHIPPSAS